MEMLKHFPYLLSQNYNCTSYKGFLNVKGEHIYVSVTLEPSPSLSGSLRLHQLLENHQSTIKQIFSHASTPYNVFSELQALLERVKGPTVATVPSLEHLSLLKQIDEVGWKNVSDLSQALDRFIITTSDVKHRIFNLHVNIPKRYPEENPTWSADLPEKLDFYWKKNTNLLDLYKAFLDAVELYQDLWNSLAEIDNSVWVVDPINPTSKDAYRRLTTIVSGVTIGVHVTLLPRKPRAVPDCHFFGPEKYVQPLMIKCLELQKNWKEDRRVLYNLEEGLCVKFVVAQEANDEDIGQMCGICYAFNLNDAVPDTVCNNASCGQPYHSLCLYTWLQSAEGKKDESLFGKCPYCDKKITVEMK